MVNNPFDIIEPTWRSLPDLERGHWFVRFGEDLGKHPDHQGENGIPPPLAGPVQITGVGNQLIGMAISAEGGDRFRKAELDAFRPKADLLISATVNWVVTRSVVEDKPSIRANLPLEEKKGKKAVKVTLHAVPVAPTKGKVKRGDEHSGIVYLSVGRVFNASMYFVQYCKDNPADEASWIDGGQSDSCRNIEVKGLIPGEIYHFRIRCFGNGQYSAWSQIISVRIL